MNLLKQSGVIFGIWAGIGLAQAEEATPLVGTALQSTTISGYVDARASWNSGVGTPASKFSGPVVRWSFEEVVNGNTVRDSIYGLYGFLSETGAKLVPGGVSGKALKLDRAENGFVNIGNSFAYATDFSISVWIKTDQAIPEEFFHVVSRHPGGSHIGYTISISSSGKALFSSGEEETAAYSKKIVNDGKWHQIVGVYRVGAGKFIYVDGMLEGQGQDVGIDPSLASFMFGGVNFEEIPTGQYTGLIDEVEVYDRALASFEVPRKYRDTLAFREIVWQHADGRIAVWEMKGTNCLKARAYSRTEWNVTGCADINLDGHMDFLIQPKSGAKIFNTGLPLSSSAVRGINQNRPRFLVMDGTTPRIVGTPDTQLNNYLQNAERITFADCDGDSRNDLVSFREGSYNILFSNPAFASKWRQTGAVPFGFRFVGVGNFTGDSRVEFLFQTAGGRLVARPLLSATSAGSVEFPNVAAPGWKAVAVTDMNGDQKPDILWQDSNGRVAVWLMNGINRISSLLLRDGTTSPGWNIVAVD